MFYKDLDAISRFQRMALETTLLADAEALEDVARQTPAAELAGEHARSLYANSEALTHFETALALGYPEPAVLHEAIGDLRTLSGSYRQARGDYETAAALVAGLTPGEGLARIEHKLASLHHRQGEWELAESHFQAALESRTPDEQGADLAQLLADRSLNMMRLGQQSGAEELAEDLKTVQALASR